MEKTYKIQNIKVGKKNIIVTFSDDVKLKLTPGLYSDFYLYVGKNITEEEFAAIKTKNAGAQLKEYAFGLFINFSYSEFEIRKKLKAKKATQPQIDEIVSALISANLINDEAYAKEKAFSLANDYRGPNYIKQDLKSRGIKDEDIIKALNQPFDFQSSADAYALKLAKTSSAPNEKHRYQKLTNQLLRRGFTRDVVKNALKDLPRMDRSKILASLEKDYQSAKKRYGKKHVGYELKAQILRYLTEKGYTYNDIKQLLEEDNYEFN